MVDSRCLPLTPEDATPKRKNDRIDSLIHKRLNALGNKWFKVDQLARQIRTDLGRPPDWKGINLSEIILEVIKARLRSVLHATDSKTKLRIYENYADGNPGGPRWQKFTGMTAPELRVCIAAREAQIIGHECVVKVYRELLGDLEKATSGACVGDVYDSERNYLAEEQ